MKAIVPAMLFSILAGSVHAQVINVAFERGDSPYGGPTPNYTGSVGFAGVWNQVGSVSVANLRRWDGASTPISLTISNGIDGCANHFDSPFTYGDTPETTGEDASILDDWYSTGAIEAEFLFEGLEPGEYVVHTIIPPLQCATPTVEVVGSPDPARTVTADWSGVYVEGQSYARHRKRFPTAGSASSCGPFWPTTSS